MVLWTQWIWTHLQDSSREGRRGLNGVVRDWQTQRKTNLLIQWCLSLT